MLLSVLIPKGTPYGRSEMKTSFHFARSLDIKKYENSCFQR